MVCLATLRNRLFTKRIVSYGKRYLETLVSTEWLANQLSINNGNLRVVQASWEGCKDYAHGHIPSAVCFDGTICRDTESPYKNMLPSADVFQKYVSEKVGVSNDTHVVVYDDNERLPSLNYGGRVWFMFRVFGHDKVSILNGGLRQWEEEKRPLEVTSPEIKNTNFVANFRKELVTEFEQVLENVKTQSFQLVDSRVPGRYYGIGLEPYGKAGRIPNSVNIPVAKFIDPDTRLILEISELKDLFKKSKVDLNKPVTFHCGSGIHACSGILASYLCGKQDATLYDGSWAEWNKRASDDMIIK